MRKMIIIIIILAIIFVGMIIYKNNMINSKTNLSVSEIEEIEKYISEIYMWKEITKEALPEFDNVNNSDDLWTWEVVKKNLENYELTYDEIQEKAKEIFGDEFKKKFPKEGTSSFEYDSTLDKYFATETVLDGQEDTFLLNNIEKTKDGYDVEIIEYLEDYSDDNNVRIINFNNEEIGKININESEVQVQEIVKNNVNKFSKKKLLLKRQNGKLIIQKVRKE